MPVKVSVVIPVYNPGPYIQPCVDSLLDQTLPPTEYEVIFVDDGSTDETPAYLDALAAEHPHVHAIHIPNSGWPGKPRNVGFDAAQGEYVQYVDQDDQMAPDALRRLYEMGTRNGSDIVIGKVASNFRGIPRSVFRADRDKCTIYDFPLINSLTPHKMFRVEFLKEHGIRYAEGKRRLEDQLFMVQAYFPAKVVSIVGSYTCYFYSKRPDGKNAGSTRAVPSGYYGNLREVLDVVIANTEPGQFRDGLLRRFYRGEMLKRISEPAMLKYPDDYRDLMVDEIEALTKDFMTDGVHDGLQSVRRLRSTLLREDKREGLVELARRCSDVAGSVRLENLEWHNGLLEITVASQLVRGPDHEPLLVIRRGDRYILDPSFSDGLLPVEQVFDVTDEIHDFSAELTVRERETAVEWPCRGDFKAHVEEVGPIPGTDGVACRVVVRGIGILEPGPTKSRGPLAKGRWDVWIRVNGVGFAQLVRLGADRAPHVDSQCLPAVLGRPPVVTVPYFSEAQHALALSVDRRAKMLGPSTAVGDIRRLGGGQWLELQLPVATTPHTARSKATVTVRTETTSHTLAAELVPVGERLHLRFPSRLLNGVGAPGTGELVAALDGASGPEAVLGTVRVSGNGRLRLGDDIPPVDRESARRAKAVHRRASLRELGRRLEVGPVGRRIGSPLIRRLPPGARRKLRARAQRLGL